MNGSLKKAIAGIMAITSIMTCSLGSEFLVGAEAYSNDIQNVKQLSVNAAVSDTITISGNSSIPNLKKGKTASVTGTLTSKSSKITSVTVGVYDKSGKLITGSSANPNATTYNLKNLDRYVTFNTLPVGTYQYIVTASNSANSNITVINQTFTVL